MFGAVAAGAPKEKPVEAAAAVVAAGLAPKRPVDAPPKRPPQMLA